MHNTSAWNTSSVHHPALPRLPGRSHCARFRICPLAREKQHWRSPCVLWSWIESLGTLHRFHRTTVACPSLSGPNEKGESRNSHRYAVVVQDFATQWIPSYQCKTITSQKIEKSLRKFLEPSQKPKVICTDHLLEFGESCEELTWNHRTSTPSSIGDEWHCRESRSTAGSLKPPIYDATGIVNGYGRRKRISGCRTAELLKDLKGLGKLPSFGETMQSDKTLLFSNITSKDVSVVLVTSVYFSGIRKWFFFRHVHFHSGFHVMAVSKISWNGSKIAFGFTIWPRWILKWGWRKPVWFSSKNILFISFVWTIPDWGGCSQNLISSREFHSSICDRGSELFTTHKS